MAEQTTKGGTNWFNQAYMAAGGGSQDLQASRGMTKIADAIAKPVAAELQQRRAQFKKFAEWELTRKPGLTDKDYDQKIEELNKMKADYIWADNSSRMKIMRHMVDMKAEQDASDAERKSLAESIEDEKNGVGGNKKFMEDEKNQLLLEAYKNGPDANGVYKDSKGNEYSKDDMEPLLNPSNEKDGASEDMIRNLALQFKEASIESYDNTRMGLEQGSFNWDNAYAQVDNIVENGNFRSLIEDNMIQGRSSTFRSDFEAALVNQTYTWFGIEADSYTDPNLDGDNDFTTISPEDAKVIADEFLKMDSDGSPVIPEAKDWVKKYFTGHLENQHKSGQSKINYDVSVVKAQLEVGTNAEMLDPWGGRYNTIEEIERITNDLASTYGQLNPKEQEQLDDILRNFEKREQEIRSQNQYNTNTQ